MEQQKHTNRGDTCSVSVMTRGITRKPHCLEGERNFRSNWKSPVTQAGDRNGGKPFRTARHDLLYETLRVVFSRPIRALWLKNVEGLQNVPDEGGAILASNHESYLDFIIVPVSGCRPPRYLAGEVFFELPVISWAFRKMGFIRVDRRRTINAEAIRSALNYLKKGELLGVYPEGTRSSDGKLQEAYDGISFLAHISEVPVIPVAVIGTHEAWPKGRRYPRAGRCEVRFGEQLLFSRDEYRADKTVLSRTTRTIMTRIAALAGEEYPW